MADRWGDIEWDDAALDAAVRRVAAERVIDARGVRLTGAQCKALLDAARASPDEPPAFGTADFSVATFTEFADFQGVEFGAEVSFAQATFTGGATFGTATFGDTADFEGATFRGKADFTAATFSDRARFDAATFGEGARFTGATFGEDASFVKATFVDDVRFDAATFRGASSFAEAVCGANAVFSSATFDRSGLLGPMIVMGGLRLDGAVFGERVIVEASAQQATFGGAAFRGGAALRLRWAQVALDNTDLAKASVLEGLPAGFTPNGRRAFLGWEELLYDGSCSSHREPPEGFAPRIMSMRDTSVSHLTLAGVNLRDCRFARARGLDDMSYEYAEFARSPSGLRRDGWRPVRWTPRRTIADEHVWRASQRDDYAWGFGAAQYTYLPDPSPSEPRSEAQAIADIYRELRKGREDKRDEPGAADFYYGEMEMRRHSAPLSERTILWLYWMVSGYGLRAGRALLALLVTIALGAVLLQQFGFDAGQHPDDGTLLFSLESSISLFRAPEGALTPAGHVIQIVLRLAGPLFFGLALLALRGRVKR